MMLFDILLETDTLEFVRVITANSLEEAKEKAKKLGYGKGYRVEETWDE